MPVKKVKKNNHRIFAIAFSALIIGALILMVPLSLMSVKKNQDNRNQAFVGQDNISLPSNITLDRRWLYISTSPTSSQPQTRWESKTFSVAAGQQYNLAAAMVPLTLMNQGVTVSLICAESACPRADGNGAVSLNTPIETLTFNSTTSPVRVYKRLVKSLTFGRAFTGAIRISAYGGTEAAIDYAKVSGLVPNGDFNDYEERPLSRNTPTFTSETATNGFALLSKPTADSYLGNAAVAELLNDPKGMVVSRAFNSDKFDLSNGQNATEAYHQRFEYRFKALQTGYHAVKIKAKLLKRTGVFTGDDIVRMGISPSSTGVFDANVNCPTLRLISNDFQEFTCSINVTTVDPQYFKLTMLQVPGSEIQIDSIKVNGPNAQVVPNTLIDSFNATAETFMIKQPKDWGSGTNNFNDYMSRWTGKGMY